MGVAAHINYQRNALSVLPFGEPDQQWCYDT